MLFLDEFADMLLGYATNIHLWVKYARLAVSLIVTVEGLLLRYLSMADLTRLFNDLSALKQSGGATELALTR